MMTRLLRPWGRRFISLLCFISFCLRSAESITVYLRTGSVDLRVVPSSSAVSDGPLPGISSIHDTNTYSYDKWGISVNQRLLLLAYNDDRQASALQAQLLAEDATIVAFIPDRTLLVAADPDRALRVARQAGAHAAFLGSQHKIAPDWDPLLSALQTAKEQQRTETSPAGRNSSDDADYIARMSERAHAQRLSRLRTLQASPIAPIRYGVVVQLIPGVPRGLLEVLKVDWPPQLPAKGCRSVVSTSGSLLAEAEDVGGSVVDASSCGPLLYVYLCVEDLAAGVRWLADQPVTKWIAPSYRLQSMNAASSILIQTGALTRLQYKNPAILLKRNQPYWAAGLMGDGEIVGVGDTGLDVEQCYFADPRFNGSFAAALADPSIAPKIGIMSYARMPGHRKVVQYALMQTASDRLDTYGHGTLVSGSVAGARLASPTDPLGRTRLDAATGAAPRARISFVDGQNLSDNGNNLWIPADVNKYYLPVHRQAGATITSDSWGSSDLASGYDAMSQSFDLYLWRNPGVISLVAAGNFGREVLAASAIGAPAGAKNVVSVGAGFRLPQQPVEGDSSSVARFYRLRGMQLDGTLFSSTIFPAENANYPLISVVRGETRTLPVLAASPLNACKPLRNAVVGAVVLLAFGDDCDFQTQARNVYAAGGAAAMAFMNSSLPAFAPEPQLPDAFYRMAVSMISQDWGISLVSFLYDGGSLNITSEQVKLNSDSIADFSSWGPTHDGRIKPDIVAPGTAVVSAWTSEGDPAGGRCRQMRYWGTSAATPLAAGHVALMRQYLRAGFYPTGSSTDPLSAPFTPSGILLKALMIAGAASLEGGVALSKGVVMGPPPDYFQGWGRLSLAGTLPLAGYTDPRFRLQVVDMGQFMSPGRSYTLAGLTATGTGPVTIVLAWYDYPADPNARTALVNDLNLAVNVLSAQGNRTYLGNNDDDTAAPTPDSVNTVERVLLSSPPAGARFKATVTAASLPSLRLDPSTMQRWALAVVGHFEGTIQSNINPAWTKQQSLTQPLPPMPPPKKREKPSARRPKQALKSPHQ